MSDSLNPRELDDIFIQDKSEIYDEHELYKLKMLKMTDRKLYTELKYEHLNDLVEKGILGYNDDTQKYWVK